MTKEANTSKVKTSKSSKQGVVTSDKMDKTIIVRVDSLKKHPRYQKRYISSKKYKVHDEKNEFSVGDEVMIESCKPISRDKQWSVVG